MEHGTRPWAALRAALGANEVLQAAVVPWGDDPEDNGSEFSDLRRLLDGRLLEQLKLQQSALADSIATDPAARATFRHLFKRMQDLKQRLGPGAETAL